MTEAPHLLATRTAYDIVAADYAELLRDHLAGSTFDRAMLSTFAELVTASGLGPVADVGCGPGRITTHLADLGLTVFGVDLSPQMVSVAQQAYPDLQFETGTMTDLDLADVSLGGVVAWYSIIHTPPELLPQVFAEFDRVLRPGGHLLLAFQVGDVVRHLEQGYGHEISLDAYRLSPDRITALLGEAGFVVHATLVREAEPPEKTRQAYLVVRKPSGWGPGPDRSAGT